MSPLARVILFGFIALFVPPLASAQSGKIDSLESLIKSVPADTTKVWLLNELVGELRNRDSQKALKFSEDATSLAQVLLYDAGLAMALENTGWIYYRMGDFNKAFDISVHAIRTYEKTKNKSGIARCLINMAAIHYQHKQVQLAIENLKKAYEISSSLNDKRTMTRSLNNLTFGYLQLNNADSAALFINRALPLAREIRDNYLIAYAIRCIGDIHMLRAEFTQAVKSYEECLAIGVAEGNTFLQISTMHRLGDVHNRMKHYQKALDYLLPNVTLAKKHRYREELERTYKFLSEAYVGLKDVNNAFTFQSRYIALHDSLYDERQAQEIAVIQNRFTTEMNKAQIDLLTKEAAVQASEIKSQKAWLYFYIGCFSLALLLVLVLYSNNRSTARAKTELEEKNLAIQRQSKQLQNLNATKDKLFSIISHDLRSPLSSLKALMELVGTPGLTQEEFVNITIVLKRNLDSVYGDLDNLLMWAQSQLKGLQAVPDAINLRELVDEKIRLFAETASAKNIQLNNLIGETVSVKADRNHLNLIIRNLVANAIKFNPEGGVVDINAVQANGGYEISVADSGVGMSDEDIDKLFNARQHFTRPGTNQERGVGIGLLLTKEFVESNNGSIWVSSTLGKGTTFTFTLEGARSSQLA